MEKAIFRKPDSLLLYDLGYSCYDMHFHTQYSDSYTKISSIIKKAAKMKIGVAITDHNEIGGVIEASENKLGVSIIPGIEVSAIDGPHILVYFYTLEELKDYYDRFILPNKGINPNMAISLKTGEIINSARKYNSVISAAHPYGYPGFNVGLFKAVKKGILNKSVIKKIDAAEAISGLMPRKLNLDSYKKIMAENLGITGGTDGHVLRFLGRILTCSTARTKEGFLDDIKNRRTFVVGKEIGSISKIIPSSKVATKHMKYLGPSVKKQYEININRVKKLPKKVITKIKSKSLRKVKP